MAGPGPANSAETPETEGSAATSIDNHSHLWRNAGVHLSAELPVYVCICNGVTARDIRQVAEAGCNTIPELTMRTGCGASCGSCLELAAELLDEVHALRELPLPVLSQAA